MHSGQERLIKLSELIDKYEEHGDNNLVAGDSGVISLRPPNKLKVQGRVRTFLLGDQMEEEDKLTLNSILNPIAYKLTSAESADYQEEQARKLSEFDSQLFAQSGHLGGGRPRRWSVRKHRKKRKSKKRKSKRRVSFRKDL